MTDMLVCLWSAGMVRVTIWNTSAWSFLVSSLWKGQSVFLCKAFPVWTAFYNYSQSCMYLSVVKMTLSNAPQPRTALLVPFVAMCCLATEVASAAWQVRVYVWPSPTVNDLHVLDLAKAAISVMAIISQPHCSCSPIVLHSYSLNPLSFPTISASSYRIIPVIKPVEEDTMYRYFSLGECVQFSAVMAVKCTVSCLRGGFT